MRAFLYPVLVSLAVPLALAAENLNRGVQPPDVLLPVALAACFAVAAELLGRTFSDDPDQRALVAAVLVLLAYTPALFGGLIPDAGPDPLRSVALLLLASLGGLAAGSLLVRARLGTSSVTDFLFFLALIVCTVQGVQLLRGWTGEPEPPPSPPSLDEPYDPEGPDIWVIVVDAYTSPGVLKDSYDLDIGEFVAELENRGFEVPERSHANYVNTVLSLAALLNQRYLDGAADGFGRDDESLEQGARLLEDNKTIRDLRQRGYQFVFFRSPFHFLARNRFADLQVPDRVTGEFTRYWLRQTLLAPAVATYCWLAGCEPMLDLAEDAREIERRMELLVRLAEAREHRPRFVLAHFLVPHGPMRLTASCEDMEPIWPTTAQEAESDRLRALYADQVRCTNRLMLALVDSLLAASRVPPVIVLQGDHGYGRFPLGRTRSLGASSAEQVDDRASVFGAYLVPQNDFADSHFWEGITPVNVMRVVMNALFDSQLDPLPDRTFWSDWDRPYAFEEVLY